MDFSEKFRVRRIVRCDEKSISIKTYQRQYVYRGFCEMTSLYRHIKKQTVILCSYHDTCLIIDIIYVKINKKNVLIIANTCTIYFEKKKEKKN